MARLDNERGGKCGQIWGSGCSPSNDGAGTGGSDGWLPLPSGSGGGGGGKGDDDDDAVTALIDKYADQLGQIGFGGVLGACSGYALKKVKCSPQNLSFAIRKSSPPKWYHLE